MVRRSKNWNKDLAEDLKDLEFARDFILAASEDGLSLQRVLEKVVRLYGVKEFSELCGIESPNILRVIDPKSNPTQKSLNLLLKPFGLALGAVSLPKEKKKKAKKSKFVSQIAPK